MRDPSGLDRSEGAPNGCPDTRCRSNGESLAQSCVALCRAGYVPELSLLFPSDPKQKDANVPSVGSGFDVFLAEEVSFRNLASSSTLGKGARSEGCEKSSSKTKGDSLFPMTSERLHLPGEDRKTRRPAAEELGEGLSESLTLQLRKLQEERYHLRWSARDVAERALHEALKQAKLPGFTGWAAQEIINQVLEKVEESQAPMPDYALRSSGAAVIHSRTSPSFRNTKGKVFLFSLPLLDYVRSPEVILEPENHPGNCWPFPGSQGQVYIKLAAPIIPRAVSMDHVSGTAFRGDAISKAPKDFAVYVSHFSGVGGCVAFRSGG
ncbi:SUN domain-containing protein 1-like [Calonectris borealis]|uniref:SUN domain-containing protein 1-like n=1 Tax=Calonectris borealis TaxID=1323832 RepID=UPI003F4BEA44